MRGYRGTQVANGTLKGIEGRVESIVNIHRNRWDCVVDKGHGRVYRLKK